MNMPDTTAKAPSLPEVPLRRRILQLLGFVGVIALLRWSADALELHFLDLWTFRGNMSEYARGFLRPSFGDWRFYIREMWVTIQIAVWGTLFAIAAAVPFGLLSASNIAPPWVYQPVRRAMDTCRAINEMIFAMLFISAVGLGPLAGILALFVHTTGTLAKLFSEAVEAIDARPVEGIRAAGSNAIEDVTFGVIPQVMPLWVSYSLYRFEANVRSASVVGMVGAGGIGAVLWDAIRGFQYSETAAMILIIIVTVSLVDVASSRLRRLFV
ncbi:MAG: phosphonate ABC transporter, permease protein PhnE [Candidatus Methylomirabilia bacterium]